MTDETKTPQCRIDITEDESYIIGDAIPIHAIAYENGGEVKNIALSLDGEEIAKSDGNEIDYLMTTDDLVSGRYSISCEATVTPFIWCKEAVTIVLVENFATVTTNNITNITDSSATSGGVIVSHNESEIIERGVCWSLNDNPSISDWSINRTIDGNGAGEFTSYLTGLSANKTYYVRAYATNHIGALYGQEIKFTTKDNSSR